jgi:hypothetical protein
LKYKTVLRERNPDNANKSEAELKKLDVYEKVMAMLTVHN